MIQNYLNLEVQIGTADQISEKRSTLIKIINKQENLNALGLSDSLKSQVFSAFEKETDQVFLNYAQQTEIIVISTQNGLEDWRCLGGNVTNLLQTNKIETAIIVEFDGSEEQKNAFLEGMILSSYIFEKYLKKQKAFKIMVTISDSAITAKSLKDLQSLTTSVGMVRTMVNEPLNKLNALSFSSLAEAMAEKFGFETKVLHQEEIKKLKMGGLLGVNQGSETPATFNIFTHKPANAVNEKPLVLVGKGVMFDTGGYSVKVGGNMVGMKADMAGGAAVLGTVAALAMNEIPYYVIGLVPATDNMISGKALVVDDIITMMDGTTVEVLNTDAEGRLVLADALTYAKKFNPQLVIDMATLTGASAAITGTFGVAMAGNSQENMDKLMVAGDTVYERLVQLPFWKEYEKLLKSNVADLKNIGGPIGGATTAGKFLEHFTDYPWIHLDIAGASYLENKDSDYKQQGASAVGVRLIYQFIQNELAKNV
ncbi:leucyl aminopeptidase family protein [Flavobacterium ardleyense]|uniref:leucyl aminopeptidase family protein n=1 Tax=Flavobacterium ardleyense TaxID=2038737 RepID=UPI00298CF917|nr:leucyl aminopeptidase [Flavobacterium ardleyense]